MQCMQVENILLLIAYKFKNEQIPFICVRYTAETLCVKDAETDQEYLPLTKLYNGK
jgi:hypothetical protein